NRPRKGKGKCLMPYHSMIYRIRQQGSLHDIPTGWKKNTAERRENEKSLHKGLAGPLIRKLEIGSSLTMLAKFFGVFRVPGPMLAPLGAPRSRFRAGARRHGPDSGRTPRPSRRGPSGASPSPASVPVARRGPRPSCRDPGTTTAPTAAGSPHARPPASG